MSISVAAGCANIERRMCVMRQDKALKILTDNLDDIKREFGVKSIGVFPWRESPPCGCKCGCDCCRPLTKEIGVAVKYMPGPNAGFEFFSLQIYLEELFECGILLARIDVKPDPRWKGAYDFVENVVYAG